MAVRAVPAERTGTRSVDADSVVAAATRHYLAGRAIDMSDLADELGVGRATLYRRVGKHEDLLARVLAEQTERTFRSVPTVVVRDVDTACATLAAFVQAVLTAPALGALIDRDPVLFMRVVLGPGPVEDRGIDLVEELIAPLFPLFPAAPAVPARLLARAIVRMSDATMYTHLLTGRPAEAEELTVLIRLLLGAAVPSK